uniref:Uncharacterized protein n=1 Tax=Glossina palpalis gambiensis TaxID=67801 RepID=A0A1B0ARV2_9MUSC
MLYFVQRERGKTSSQFVSDIALQVIAARKIQYFFRHRVSSKRLTAYFVLVTPAAAQVACEIVSMTAHLTVQNEPGDKEEKADVDPIDFFNIDWLGEMTRSHALTHTDPQTL